MQDLQTKMQLAKEKLEALHKNFDKKMKEFSFKDILDVKNRISNKLLIRNDLSSANEEEIKMLTS